MSYQLHPESGVIELATGARIQRGEPGWEAYRQWTKAGGVASAAPVELEPIEDVRQRVRSQVTTWRDQQERGRIIFEHDGRRWDGGIDVRKRLQPVLNLPALPAGFFWTDADNNDVPMIAESLAALNAAHEQAIIARGWAIHVRQREMKAEIDLLSGAALGNYFIGWLADKPVEMPIS